MVLFAAEGPGIMIVVAFLLLPGMAVLLYGLDRMEDWLFTREHQTSASGIVPGLGRNHAPSSSRTSGRDGLTLFDLP
ncbi:hypothetical protein [Streptomyces sp. NPDC050738]|uniref:hypothetical protein n=1 Tax=Streptomyces sp. NPDC050738 TaxID=3154744 RepID=UPI00343D64D1